VDDDMMTTTRWIYDRTIGKKVSVQSVTQFVSCLLIWTRLGFSINATNWQTHKLLHLFPFLLLLDGKRKINSFWLETGKREIYIYGLVCALYWWWYVSWLNAIIKVPIDWAIKPEITIYVFNRANIYFE